MTIRADTSKPNMWQNPKSDMSLWYKGYVDALRSSDWMYRRRANSIPVQSARGWRRRNAIFRTARIAGEIHLLLEGVSRYHRGYMVRGPFGTASGTQIKSGLGHGTTRDASVAAASSGFLTVIRALHDASFSPDIVSRGRPYNDGTMYFFRRSLRKKATATT